MIFLRRLLNIYIDYSIHVALAISALLLITLAHFGMSVQFSLLFVVFSGTVTGYNFLKYASLCAKVSFLKIHKILLLITLSALTMFVYFFPKLFWNQQIVLLAMGSVVLLYPFLRKNGILKMFSVSFVIAVVTTGVPLLEQNYELKLMIFESFQRFLWVSALMIPFEIVDTQVDEIQLKTIPQRWGVRFAKTLGCLLLCLYLVVRYLIGHLIVIDLLIAFLLLATILLVNENRTKYFTSFWAESIPILWWVLLLF
ncbi:MAG: hypothetical protein RBR78_00230 [Flavobacteriaceae bacterium]|nr:hypothetical protein [Flavobacteriaceae bacterium]